MIQTWCRLHADIRRNRKVFDLSHRDRWVYICWLTFETDGSLEGIASDKYLARECDLSEAELLEAIEALQAADLLTPDRRVKNFEERQYKDPHAAERNRQYRARQKASRVTPPETQPDTSRGASRRYASDQIRTEQKGDSRRDPEGDLPDWQRNLKIAGGQA